MHDDVFGTQRNKPRNKSTFELSTDHKRPIANGDGIDGRTSQGTD